MNSWILCPDYLYCQVCEATCGLNMTSEKFALFPAMCILHKELCMQFALLPWAQPFVNHKFPPTQLPMAGSVSVLCVPVIFLRGKPYHCLSCTTHPMMFPDQFSSSLWVVNQASSTESVVWTIGSVETLTNAAPFTTFPGGSLGSVCVLDKCSASSSLTNITSAHWILHLDLISPGYL